MSSRAPEAAENFDSTAKLMLETLARASADLEKAVANFTDQLGSYNDMLQRSLEEDLKAVDLRLAESIRLNLDELSHNRNLLVKQMEEAAAAEVESVLAAGRSVRKTLRQHAEQAERRIEGFIAEQMTDLKTYLAEPEERITRSHNASAKRLDEFLEGAATKTKDLQTRNTRNLTDKAVDLHSTIESEMAAAKQTALAAMETCCRQLTVREGIVANDIEQICRQTLDEIDRGTHEGLTQIASSENRSRDALEQIKKQWKSQVQELTGEFDQALAKLGTVLKENYDTRLSAVSAQSRSEISELTAQAHEKIAATRRELEVQLKALEREYLEKFAGVLRKLDDLVAGATSARGEGVAARQLKSVKLRDQMQHHLRKWGTGLIDTVRDAAAEMEQDFLRSTDGFHIRIENARNQAIELLEREAKLMGKDVERTIKEFQKELTDLERQLGHIEKAGQDAAITVIAYRKAMLSLGGE